MSSPFNLPPGARVLVRLPNWLGDVVLCTPALSALAEARPDLELSVLVKPGLRDLVRTLPGVCEVLVLEGTSASAVWRQSRVLRQRDFAAALVFPKGFREALLCALARIPIRCGLATDRRGFLLTHAVPFGPEEWRAHHALQFGRVLAPLGLDVSGARATFPLETADREEAVRVLREAGLEGRRFAVFHIAASKPPRAWHPDRFGAVAAGLLREEGLPTVLVGSPGDAPVHVLLKEACPEAVDLAGKTSVRGMAALLERASLFVGNDSGPMHLAAALGAPVVAVFGPGSPVKTAPRDTAGGVRVVYASLPCSPCRQSFWKECVPSPAGKPPCLEAVSPESVLAVARELLSGRGS